MFNLKSVGKPEATGGLEHMAAEAAQPRLTNAGHKGNLPTQPSRTVKSLVVTGKGERIRPVPVPSGIESVLGRDDRVRVLDTDLAPWRMICALRMEGTFGAAIGTGWLVGPRTIITAGHCVHHIPFLGGWATAIQVSAGRNGEEFPFETITATRFSSVDAWINDANPDFDYGCIHLEEPLGDHVGWFGIGSLTPSELEGHMLNISGYPADRGAGSEQYFHANRVLHVSDRRVFYDVDTFGGQSGAPVWVQEDAEDDPLVIGIHAYGTGGTPFDLGIEANSAPRIIPEVFELIKGWITEDTPES